MCQTVSKPWYSNWTIKHNVDILDYYHGKGKGVKKQTYKWVTNLYGKVMYKSTLNRWVNDETNIRGSTLGDGQKVCDVAVSN